MGNSLLHNARWIPDFVIPNSIIHTPKILLIWIFGFLAQSNWHIRIVFLKIIQFSNRLSNCDHSI